MDVKKLMAEGSLDNLSEDLFKSVSSYSEEVKAFQRQKAAEYADQVVAALKKIEQDIKDRYDRVGLTLEKRVLNIKDGKDGINGRDGRDGKDGKPGAAGLPGRDGKDGKNGRDGVDGKDGVSVVNAFLDFDNSLVIELSNGKQVNAGAILGADFAEKVKIIANGGGTSQGVIDTLASLQAQISAISSLGAVSYQGTWNASTNTPTITASVGTKGYYYVVSVAGTTSINGESKWGVGDWIVFNGSAWQKVDGGSTGNLTTLDVSGAAAIGGSLTISGGTANGVAYLNGSKVLSTDGNLAFDGTSFSTGGSIYFSSNVGYYLYAGGNAGAQLKVLGYGSEGVAFKNYTGTTEYMRLDSTGLGIGTSSPGAKLDVLGGSTTAFRAYSSTANVGGIITSFNNTSANYYDADTHTFRFGNGGGPSVVINSSGNLGLGVTPSAGSTHIDVSAGGSLYGLGNGAQLAANSNFSGGSWLYRSSAFASRIDINPGNTGGVAFYTAPSGTAGNAISFTQAMTLDASGNLVLGDTSATGRLSVVGNYAFFRENASGADVYIRGYYGNANIAAIQVATNSPLAFVTNNAERMRLDSSGNFIVNGTAAGVINNDAFWTSTSAYFGQNHSNGTASGTNYVYFAYNGGTIGSISQNGTTAVAYNTSSDYRLKNIDGPLTGSGEFIDALKPKVGTWKADGSKFVGFLAHEVQEVSPQTVVGEKDAVDEEGKPIMQAMEYGSAEFIANIIAELQSLRKRVAELEAK